MAIKQEKELSEEKRFYAHLAENDQIPSLNQMQEKFVFLLDSEKTNN